MHLSFPPGSHKYLILKQEENHKKEQRHLKPKLDELDEDRTISAKARTWKNINADLEIKTFSALLSTR